MCISLLFIFSFFPTGMLNIRNLSDQFMTKDLKNSAHVVWLNDKKEGILLFSYVDAAMKNFKIKKIKSLA